jgi:hypothetical protein
VGSNVEIVRQHHTELRYMYNHLETELNSTAIYKTLDTNKRFNFFMLMLKKRQRGGGTRGVQERP